MKRLAIFVEGLTEQIFVKKLLDEIAGVNNIHFQLQKARTTRKGNLGFITIEGSSPDAHQQYSVLIFDCGNDDRVSSCIKDRCEGLGRAGYEKVLGLRDANSNVDIVKLKQHVMYGVPTKHLPVHIVLAIIEIEAWFLAETNHFAKIHRSLTKNRVKQILNFDPDTENVETRPHPATDLHTVYQVVGRSYMRNNSHAKTRSRIQRTVDFLDYENMYENLTGRVGQLGEFIRHIDSFLVPMAGDTHHRLKPAK